MQEVFIRSVCCDVQKIDESVNSEVQNRFMVLLKNIEEEPDKIEGEAKNIYMETKST